VWATATTKAAQNTVKPLLCASTRRTSHGTYGYGKTLFSLARLPCIFFTITCSQKGLDGPEHICRVRPKTQWINDENAATNDAKISNTNEHIRSLVLLKTQLACLDLTRKVIMYTPLVIINQYI
jgi:hypothetical protein